MDRRFSCLAYLTFDSQNSPGPDLSNLSRATLSQEKISLSSHGGLTRPPERIPLLRKHRCPLFIYHYIRRVQEQQTCRCRQRMARFVILPPSWNFRKKQFPLYRRCEIKLLVVPADKIWRRRVTSIPVLTLNGRTPYLGVTQQQKALKRPIQQTVLQSHRRTHLFIISWHTSISRPTYLHSFTSPVNGMSISVSMQPPQRFSSTPPLPPRPNRSYHLHKTEYEPVYCPSIGMDPDCSTSKGTPSFLYLSTSACDHFICAGAPFHTRRPSKRPLGPASLTTALLTQSESRHSTEIPSN